ncbi:unnamed protein product, partial [Rotaria sp. Silwood1]
ALLTLGLEGIQLGDQGAEHLGNALLRNKVTFVLPLQLIPIFT